MAALSVQAFDRKDGSGVDWQLLTDSLFRAAFDQLDRLPEADRSRMAARVHAAAYERFLSTEAGRGGSDSGTAPQGHQKLGTALAFTPQPDMTR